MPLGFRLAQAVFDRIVRDLKLERIDRARPHQRSKVSPATTSRLN